MPSKPHRLLAAVAAVLIICATGTAGAVSTAPPVITQAPVTSGGSVKILTTNPTQLRFTAVIRVGSGGGPLSLFGSRVDTSVNTMDAFQKVNGTNKLAGAFQYNYDVTHQHWHYLSLDHYDLRPHDPSQINLTVGRDQKTGFCLFDNSQANPNPTDCEKGQPLAMAVSEAVQPGGSDTYVGGVDGQFIDLTGVASGTYELVQWVNADCRLTDSGPAGHTAAVVISYDATHHTVSTTGDTPFWNNYYKNLPPSQQCLQTETQRPQVSGTAQVGQVLSTVPGSWLQRMATNFTYQWRRCDSTGWACSDITGATSANYTPSSADVGHMLRARVTATNAPTMDSASPEDSEATDVVTVAPPPTTPPTPSSSGGSSTPPPSSGQPVAGQHGAGPPLSLTAALNFSHTASIRHLLRTGLSARVHCSMGCRIRLELDAPGGVPLGHTTSKLTSAATRTLRLRLSSNAKKVVSHFGARRLTLWLHVRSSDGEQQTLARVLRLRR